MCEERMKVSIYYSYQCICGYSHSKVDTQNAVGAHIRPVIDAVSSCPKCHRLLPVEVTLTYSTMTPVIVVEADTKREKQENALAEIANMCQELGIYD